MSLTFKSSPEYPGGVAYDPKRDITFVRLGRMYGSPDRYKVLFSGNEIGIAAKQLPSIGDENTSIKRWAVLNVKCTYKSEPDKRGLAKHEVEALIRETLVIACINSSHPGLLTVKRQLDIDFSETVWSL